MLNFRVPAYPAKKTIFQHTGVIILPTQTMHVHHGNHRKSLTGLTTIIDLYCVIPPKQVPSRKLTVRTCLKMTPWKFGDSFWKPPFLCAKMLVSL